VGDLGLPSVSRIAHADADADADADGRKCEDG